MSVVRMHDLWNTKELMAELDVARTRIYKLISEEGLPPPIKIGRGSYWIVQEVKDWVQARLDAAIAARNEPGTNLMTYEAKLKTDLLHVGVRACVELGYAIECLAPEAEVADKRLEQDPSAVSGVVDVLVNLIEIQNSLFEALTPVLGVDAEELVHKISVAEHEAWRATLPAQVVAS